MSTMTSYSDNESKGKLKIDAKKLQTLFVIFYKGFQSNRSSQERLVRMTKGQISSNARKIAEQNYQHKDKAIH